MLGVQGPFRGLQGIGVGFWGHLGNLCVLIGAAPILAPPGPTSWPPGLISRRPRSILQLFISIQGSKRAIIFYLSVGVGGDQNF